MGNLSSFTNATVAPQIVATGTLAAGQTDFGTSLAFPVNQYPTQQIGAVLVYLDGQLLLRNVGNATAAPTADGDYQEIDAGNGFSILVRLNIADPLSARTYTIVSNGFTVAQPTSVYQSQLQTLQTQQDVMASTLANVAGVTTASFYAVPNDTTRLTFTNRVTALETNSASKNASNTWTVPQLMLGQTNGAAIASGYIGQEVKATSTNVMVVTGSPAYDTWYDISGMSIELTPGVWDLSAACIISSAYYATFGSVLQGHQLGIRQGSSVVVVNIVETSPNPNYGASTTNTIIPTRIVIGSALTYKLSVRVRQTYSGSITGNFNVDGRFDSPIVLRATRIA